MEFTLRKWEENDARSVLKYADNKKYPTTCAMYFPTLTRSRTRRCMSGNARTAARKRICAALSS